MIITLKELNKFMPEIKLDASVEKAINNLGYEVESILPFSDVKGVKFAKVVNVYPNPNSKNLTVVELLLANNDKVTIQTNAKNARVGAYTTAFVIGSQKGEITFGAKTMAGIESQGMLSNFNELGFDISKLPFNADEVMMLDEQLPLDADPVEYFGLDDYIIDITTPANRSDANSYYVLARELAAYYNTKFTWFKWDTRFIKPRFETKIRSDKNVAEALSFIEAKQTKTKTNLLDMLFLAKHGVEAKNIWAIDVTNLALLYVGTPAHAYDADKIQNRLKCEEFSGQVNILGGKSVNVNNVLAISDTNGPVSLACVMGLEHTSVSEQTKSVVFEIGSFESKKVRHGAKEIKIESASSIQGGRGVNTEMVRLGMQYLQFKAYADKQPFSNIVGLPKAKKGNSVLQNRKKLALYANCTIAQLRKFADVENKLKTLDFKLDKNRVTAPSYRRDINAYEDVIEEYFRFYGYTNFEPIKPTLVPFKVNRRDISKNLIQAMGYKEVRTFSLESVENNQLNPFGYENSVKLQTFVSKEREVIRNSIITSMLGVVDYNFKRKMEKISIFEFGMINYNDYSIGLVSNIKTFDEIKQDIINYLKIQDLEFVPFKDNEYIHPNVSAKIMYNGSMIGWIGKIHPRYASQNVWVAEFKDQDIKPIPSFNSYDAKPLKSIDLTFEIDLHSSIASKIELIKQNFNIFSISQIDTYLTPTSQKITLRILADSEVIEQISTKFN
ncbi:phenylalanine--tRNA ligase subunit beta [Mycoplasma simbae]|uniref:phenylalanine--tRNA ligase subunit beta n=1 Tax=Mycoplasma simbae TaxID=36744 RepID=UPI000496CB3D|nr:phenylalanine--tRNA ligase subunit beta [Mycoplasma simbae]